jgi:signal transduction histidine kinase
VSHDRVLVVMPVSGDGRDLGVVALLRPTERLDYGLRTFWLSLVAIAAGALAPGGHPALGLSRWVGRPLAVLDASARRLGDGDLSVRLPDASCPPEFRHLAHIFNTMAARLEALVHGHRAVIADVSHQLRTPLAALRLRLDLLTPPDSAEDAAGYAGALGEVARLSRLVDGLLAVARAENATPQPAAVRGRPGDHRGRRGLVAGRRGARRSARHLPAPAGHGPGRRRLPGADPGQPDR